MKLGMPLGGELEVPDDTMRRLIQAAEILSVRGTSCCYHSDTCKFPMWYYFSLLNYQPEHALCDVHAPMLPGDEDMYLAIGIYVSARLVATRAAN